jgi:hypothetical protein
MNLSRVKVLVYVGLIFLSGVVVGVFGHQFYTIGAVDANSRQRPEEWRRQYVSEMRSRLKLDDLQMQKLSAILDETRTRVHEARERHRPELDAIIAEQKNLIRAMLNDTQRVEYEKVQLEREKRKQEEREKSGRKLGSGPGF